MQLGDVLVVAPEKEAVIDVIVNLAVSEIAKFVRVIGTLGKRHLSNLAVDVSIPVNLPHEIVLGEIQSQTNQLLEPVINSSNP